MHKLVVILKNGRTVVLTTATDPAKLKEGFTKILEQLKKDFKYIIISNESEDVLIVTDELAAVMITTAREEQKGA